MLLRNQRLKPQPEVPRSSYKTDGRGAARILATLSFASLYVWVISTSISDSDVVLDRSISIAPVLSVKVSADTYLFFAPLALAVLFFYWHLTAYRLRNQPGSRGGNTDYGQIWFFSDLTAVWFMPKALRQNGWRFDVALAFILIYVAPVWALLVTVYTSLAKHSITLFDATLIALLIVAISPALYAMARPLKRLVLFVVLCFFLGCFGLSGLSVIRGPIRPCRDTTILPNWPDQRVVQEICALQDNPASGSGISRTAFKRFAFYVERPANFYGTGLMTASPNFSGLGTDEEMSGPIFLGLNLRDADFDSVSIPHADIQKSDLSGAWLWSIEMSKSFLSSSNFTLASLSISDLGGSDIRDTYFTGALLDWTSFQNSTLWTSHFDHADLEHAFLDYVTAVGSTFKGADLTGASMKGALFIYCDFSGAKGLTQMQLNTACGQWTILPNGLHLKHCDEH